MRAGMEEVKKRGRKVERGGEWKSKKKRRRRGKRKRRVKMGDGKNVMRNVMVQ